MDFEIVIETVGSDHDLTEGTATAEVNDANVLDRTINAVSLIDDGGEIINELLQAAIEPIETNTFEHVAVDSAVDVGNGDEQTEVVEFAVVGAEKPTDFSIKLKRLDPEVLY